MSNFKSSVENKVEGVETDVWLSKDGVPMITHGGDDG
jgi:glycerophosphoryl diester phosphodiesterase